MLPGEKTRAKLVCSGNYPTCVAISAERLKIGAYALA